VSKTRRLKPKTRTKVADPSKKRKDDDGRASTNSRKTAESKTETQSAVVNGMHLQQQHISIK